MGDYPIEDALPLIGYTPQVSQQIQHARRVTQRSQADRNDKWECAYRYNKNKKLLSVSAADGKMIRFRKQVSYKGGRISYIRSYLNIEDRQITDKITSFTSNDRLLLKWQEHVLETGKNREIDLATTFVRHELGMLRKLDLSPAEILNLFKPAHNNGHTKNYVD
ncbi:hypothetical protein ABIB62_004097 [Mucilaginibacter sp. UYP25]|uniref:hypothetical protein n=1 Tax=unclassified Mucilaginibacter TaxID=2617802 RepID=UPI0033918652